MTNDDNLRDEFDPERFERQQSAASRLFATLSHRCHNDGCNRIARFPSDYCSAECENEHVELIADRVTDLMESGNDL